MVERSPARLLAPLALVAFVVALVLVIATTEGPPQPPAATGPSTERREPARPARRTYVVKPGDNLTKISEKTGVPLERLRELNPALDPRVMVPGQRLKLRP